MEESVETNKLAIASLVLAAICPVIWWIILQVLMVVWFFDMLTILFILSPPIIIGIIALHQIRKSEGRQKGNQLAWIGIIVGSVEIVFVVCYILYEILLLIASG